jgi:hypothetical protein
MLSRRPPSVRPSVPIWSRLRPNGGTERPDFRYRDRSGPNEGRVRRWAWSVKRLTGGQRVSPLRLSLTGARSATIFCCCWRADTSHNQEAAGETRGVILCNVSLMCLSYWFVCPCLWLRIRGPDSDNKEKWEGKEMFSFSSCEHRFLHWWWWETITEWGATLSFLSPIFHG